MIIKRFFVINACYPRLKLNFPEHPASDINMSFLHNIPLYLPGEELKLQVETSYCKYIPTDRIITVNIEEQVKRGTDTTSHPLVVISFGGLRAVLKLYDHRYPKVREYYDSQQPPWSDDREAQVLQFIGTPLGQRLSDPILRSKAYEDLDLWRSVPKFAYSTLREETGIYADCVNKYQTEVRAYNTLKPLQSQGRIPKLLATVSFQLKQVADPVLQEYSTIRGIILEHIVDSQCLGRIMDSPIPTGHWDRICKSALGLATAYGKLGILYPEDWGMEYNFLIRKDYSVVLTDFSECKFEQDYDTWQDWVIAKARSPAETSLYYRLRRLLMSNGQACWEPIYESIWGSYEYRGQKGEWRYRPPSNNDIQNHNHHFPPASKLYWMKGREWDEVVRIDHNGQGISRSHQTSRVCTMAEFYEE